ncbi:unnamed protein product [Symbiodinium natans]|uniref:Uncharacterized protein n=1 Tax=Symbiodinium natans TaxID=878477 RepID=A0A812J9W8_9DINO|nr:unnamed protein product [Symbiodinium natans]
MHPLRSSTSTTKWATLVPLTFAASIRRKWVPNKGLVLFPAAGGRCRKRDRGQRSDNGSVKNPPWKQAKGETDLGYYRRREHLQGNKTKNRGCRKKKKDSEIEKADTSIETPDHVKSEGLTEFLDCEWIHSNGQGLMLDNDWSSYFFLPIFRRLASADVLEVEQKSGANENGGSLRLSLSLEISRPGDIFVGKLVRKIRERQASEKFRCKTWPEWTQQQGIVVTRKSRTATKCSSATTDRVREPQKPRGTVATDPETRTAKHFKDCCLVDSLRAMGHKVSYRGDGPWKISDGMQWLQPMRKTIRPCTFHDALVAQGDFLLAYSNHFVAARRRDGENLKVNCGRRTHMWKDLRVKSHSGTRALHQDLDGNMLLDPRMLDACFRVMHRDDVCEEQSLPAENDYSGGKMVEACAQQILETWESLQLEQMEPVVVPTAENLVTLNRRDGYADSDEESGFWHSWEELFGSQAPYSEGGFDDDEENILHSPVPVVVHNFDQIVNDDDTFIVCGVLEDQWNANSFAGSSLDYAGGSSVLGEDGSILTSNLMPQDVLLILPQTYFSFEFLSTWAACSRSFRDHVRQQLNWKGLDIPIDVPEFTNDEARLRRMRRLWKLARSVIMTQAQLAFLNLPLQKVLIRWEVERIPFSGERSRGYMSSQTLLGAARFLAEIPEEIRTVMIGVKSPFGTRKIFLHIREAYTERMCFCFSMSGRMDNLPTEKFPDNVLFSELRNEVTLIWNSRMFAVQINQHMFGPVQVREDLPSGPSSQAIPFIWASNPKRSPNSPRIQMLPLLTPVLPDARCLCILCGLESGLNEQQWRVCVDCNTWVCREHARALPNMQCPGCPLVLADYLGGALPPPQMPWEVVMSLPQYFFSYSYMKNLAAASKACKAAIVWGEAWRNKVVEVTWPEFTQTILLRRVEPLWRHARIVVFDIAQLAQVLEMPETAHVHFNVTSYQGFLRGGRVVQGFESNQPLMGCANFELHLPPRANGIYFGVQDLDGRKRSYCRVDNLFTADIAWSFGVTGSRVQRHPRADQHHFLPGYANRVCMKWSQRSFAVNLNDEVVIRARLRDDVGDSAMAAHNFFEKLVCSDYIRYVDAGGFVENGAFLEATTKFELVISSIYRRHAGLFQRLPEAIKLLPHPMMRAAMTKRLWEETLGRTRTILDFLEETNLNMNVVFYRYLHAQASKLPQCQLQVLGRLPHPVDFPDEKDWFRLAFEFSLSLHLLLVTGTIDGATSTSSGEAKEENVQCECRSEKLIEEEEITRAPCLVVGLTDNWTALCSSSSARTWQDVRGGASEHRASHSEWFLLSLRRAEALSRQHERRSSQEHGLLPLDGFSLWNKCYSPYCCPSYGTHTSSIRLPMFSFTHELPPVLEAAPLDWQSFKCPEISCGLLSRVHRHLRDQRISFTAGNHTYHVDGKKVSISVTGLVHFFAEEFDADAAIACMKRSQNWPREAYAKVVDGKLQPLPDAEIKELWRKNSVEASARGTWMHLQIEVFLNGGCSENPGVEIDLFAKFLQQFPTRLLAFRTEWCIYAENEDLAGYLGPFIDEVPDMAPEVHAMLQSRARSTAPPAWQDLSGGAEADSQTSFGRQIEDELEMQVDDDNARRSLEEAFAAGLVFDAARSVSQGNLVPSEEDIFRDAKKRRCMPGAETTMARLQEIFQNSDESCAESFLSMPPAVQRIHDRTIVQQKKTYLALVSQRHPTWPETVQHLAAAALTCYRTRLSDMFVRDYVALLWVMEGDRFLRAHNGTCYLYHEHGAFQAFVGMPPESTFSRVKPFLLQLEGMFRLMSSRVERSDYCLLDEIARLFDEHNSACEFLNRCLDEAIMTAGTRSTSRRQMNRLEAPERGVDAPAEAPAGTPSWPLFTADMISRVAAPLQRDLLEDPVFRQAKDRLEKFLRGPTEKKVRAACGLEDRKQEGGSSSATALAHLVRSATTVQDANEDASAECLHERVRNAMISYGLNTRGTPATKLKFSKAWWTRYSSSKIGNRTLTLDVLQDKKMVIFAGGAGDKGNVSQSFVPIIPLKKELDHVCDIAAPEQRTQLQECYDARALWKIAEQNPSRETNVQIMLSCYDKICQRLQRRRGKKSVHLLEMQDAWMSRKKKLENQENALQDLLELLESARKKTSEDAASSQAARSKPSQETGEKRRARRKRPDAVEALDASASSTARQRKENPHGEDAFVTQETIYGIVPANLGIRTRRYARGAAAQHLGRAWQALVLSHTTDLDIVNCCFNIMLQLLDKLDVDQREWSNQKETLRTYAQVSERTGLFMNPTFAAASTPFSAGQKKLMHLHTQGDPHCVALEVVTANEFIITDEKKQYKVSSTDFLKCLKAAVDSKYIVLFDIFGSEAEANAAQASNTDDALTATEMDSLRCLHAAGEAQDDDFVVDMEEATDAEEPPEESEDEGIVRVGDRLLSSLKNEVTQLKAECIPRSDGEYRCPFCPWRSWAANQSKKRVLDHVEKYHDHIHQFVYSLHAALVARFPPETCSLLPRHVNHWWPILEDLFTCPKLMCVMQGLMQEVMQHDELQVISIDCTMRCCLPLMGQAHPRSSQEAKRSAAFRGQVMTVRGRTNAVVVLEPLAADDSETCVRVLAETLPAQALAQEEMLRNHIENRSMRLRDAEHILAQINSEIPFFVRVDFIRAIAALCAVYSHEVIRVAPGPNRQVYKLLHSATAVNRAEWYFNNTRLQHMLEARRLPLLPTGTTSNESLHREINVWFRETFKLHQTSLRLKLQVLKLAKNLSHNSALYRPTTRQMKHAELLARASARPLWSYVEWQNWCRELAHDKMPDKADLPLYRERKRQQAVVKKAACKKPAASPQTRKKVHRTPHTLKRKEPNLVSRFLSVATDRGSVQSWWTFTGIVSGGAHADQSEGVCQQLQRLAMHRPVSAPHLPRASLVEEEGAGVWSRLGNICRPSSAPHLLRASLVQKEGALRAPVEEKEEESEEEVQDRPEEQAEEVIDAEAAASTQEEQEEGEDWRAGAAANWQWQWQDGTEDRRYTDMYAWPSQDRRSTDIYAWPSQVPEPSTSSRPTRNVEDWLPRAEELWIDFRVVLLALLHEWSVKCSKTILEQQSFLLQMIQAKWTETVGANRTELRIPSDWFGRQLAPVTLGLFDEALELLPNTEETLHQRIGKAINYLEGRRRLFTCLRNAIFCPRSIVVLGRKEPRELSDVDRFERLTGTVVRVDTLKTGKLVHMEYSLGGPARLISSFVKPDENHPVGASRHFCVGWRWDHYDKAWCGRDESVREHSNRRTGREEEPDNEGGNRRRLPDDAFQVLEAFLSLDIEQALIDVLKQDQCNLTDMKRRLKTKEDKPVPPTSTLQAELQIAGEKVKVGMHPLRSSTSTTKWATLVPLTFAASIRRKWVPNKGLVLFPAAGGRCRKRDRGQRSDNGSVKNPPWKQAKGETDLGYYRRREHLQGNKTKNRGCRKKKSVSSCVPVTMTKKDSEIEKADTSIETPDHVKSEGLTEFLDCEWIHSNGQGLMLDNDWSSYFFLPIFRRLASADVLEVEQKSGANENGGSLRLSLSLEISRPGDIFVGKLVRKIRERQASEKFRCKTWPEWTQQQGIVVTRKSRTATKCSSATTDRVREPQKPRGTVATDPETRTAKHFKDCCLVDSLRAMGHKVSYRGDGPWKISDGMQWLQPMRKTIRPCTFHDALVAQGDFLLAYSNHFVAARRRDGENLKVNCGRRTHMWKDLRVKSHSGTRALHQDLDGNMLLDPRMLDACFRVMHRDDVCEEQSLPAENDYSGGKMVEACAQQILETWESLQLEQMEPVVVPTAENLVTLNRRDGYADSDEESGFWHSWEELFGSQAPYSEGGFDDDEENILHSPVPVVVHNFDQIVNDDDTFIVCGVLEDQWNANSFAGSSLDYAGGSSVLGEDGSILTSNLMPQDVLLILPQTYFSFEFLSTWAACSRSFRDHVRQQLNWKGLDIPIDVPEFTNDEARLRRMRRLWKLARSVIMTQAQLAFLNLPLQKVLIRWEVERIPFSGERSRGYMSSQTLLGAARFLAEIPEEIRTVMIGVKSPFGTRKIFLHIREAYTERMCFCFSMSGRMDNLPTEKFPDNVLFSELRNEVTLIWNSRMFAVQINQHMFGPVQVREDLPSGPSSQAIPFIWASNPKRSPNSPRIQMLPLLTPVLPDARCLCILCGLESGLNEQQWRVCVDCNTWVCREHARALPNMQCPGCPLVLADYLGGALPPPQMPWEVVMSLPQYFFSYSYMKNLAAASKACKAAIVSGEAWRNKVVEVTWPEFTQTILLRRVEPLWRHARIVVFDIAQLAQVLEMPETAHVHFNVTSYQGFLRGGRVVQGFESNQPLMGCANFELHLPPRANGIYFGVQDLDGRKRSYCRVDNLFTADIAWSFGVTGSRVQRHPRADQHHFLPGYANRVCMKWSQRSFAVNLNDEVVIRARLRDDVGDSAMAAHNFFEKLVCSDYIRYVDAGGFVENGAFLEATTKFELVISSIYRRHAGLFQRLPEAIKLLPHPMMRAAMTKRLWEETLGRTRTILDFLEETNLNMNVVFYRYLHAQASKLPQCQLQVLGRLPHPVDFPDEKDWFRLAFEFSLSLHLLLVTGTIDGATSTSSGEAKEENVQCECRSEKLIEEEEITRAPCLVVGLTDNWTALCSSSSARTWQDVRGGASEHRASHSEWFLLSLRRAEALSRQHERRSSQEHGLLPLDGFSLWNKCYSPYCCPSYGTHTSSIRLPMFSFTHELPPVLEAAPLDWQSFKCPEISCGLLSRVHRHLRDQRISFTAGNHTYHVDGKKVSISVTGLVHFFAEEFDADAAIACMKRSQNWPREAYAKVVDGKLQPLPDAEIKELWRKNSVEASARGTWMHLQIEVFLNGGCSENPGVEIDLFAKFLQQFPTRLLAFRTEWCIYAENEDLAGYLGPFIDEVPDMAPEVHAMLQSRARSTAPPAWQDLSGGAEADSQTSFGRQIEDELEMQVDDDNARRSLEEAFAAGLVFDAARSVSQGNLVPSEEDIFRDAKKRRCMPGAETTMARLQEIFQNSDESCAESFLSMPPAVQRIHDRTIVQQKKTYLALVSQRHPTWPETVQHLAAAALTCYRARLSDMFVRDYVALLWVMEGDRFLRAHNGTCYLYHEHGAFQAFVGMPPESTFSRVKPFLLQLEGMFRLMSSRVERSDYCLLDEIARLFDEHNSACEFLNRCLDEAIMTAGTRSTSRRQMNRLEAPERGVDAPAEAPAGTPSWPLFTADMISRVAAPLQRDLLEDPVFRQAKDRLEKFLRGPTEKKVRAACGLEDRKQEGGSSSATALAHLVRSATTVQDANEDASAECLHERVRNAMISYGLNTRGTPATKLKFSKAWWTRYSSSKIGNRTLTLDVLQDKKMVIFAGGAGDKGNVSQSFVPIIPLKKELDHVCDIAAPEQRTQLQECYDARALWKIAEQNPSRETNVQIMLSCYDKICQRLQRRRGKKSVHLLEMQDAWMSRKKKLENQENALQDLLELLESARKKTSEDAASSQAARSKPSQETGEKRRARRKRPDAVEALDASASSTARQRKENPHGEDAFVTQETIYGIVPANLGIRTRRYARGAAAQHLGRAWQALVLSHTTDLDIVNCCFNIMLQLLDKLDVDQREWSNQKETLRRCAEERDKVIEEDIQLDGATGKDVLNKVFNGGNPTYAQVSERTGLFMNPTFAAASTPFSAGQKKLMHLHTQGDPHCVALEVVTANEFIITDEKKQYKVSSTDFLKCLKAAVDSKYIVLFDIFGSEAEANAAQASNTDDALTATEMDSLRCLHAAGEAQDDDFVVDMEEATDAEEPPEESEDEGIVRVGDRLLSSLKNEVTQLKAECIPRSDGEYRCPFCPWRSWAANQSKKRVLDHVEKYHDHIHQFVYSLHAALVARFPPETCSLLPRHVNHWWPILEDLFTCPKLMCVMQGLMQEVMQHDELQVISIDCTMRCCLPLMGQAHPRSSQEAKRSAAFRGQEASARAD